MHVSRIELKNFRNHENLVLTELNEIIIIVGNNAVGKTNIIEALQLLSMHESFRRPKQEELLTKQSKEDKISLFIEIKEEQISHSKQIKINQEGRVYIYDKKERSSKDVLGVVPSVLFTPDDLQIIKGPPEQRRNMIDSLGSRLSKTFGQIKSDYYKALKQKNTLLKQDEIDRVLLDSWNRHLAKLGASLSKHRQGLSKQIVDEASLYYFKISGGEELKGDYIMSWRESYKDEYEDTSSLLKKEEIEEELYKAFSKKEETEIAAKRSLIGPQKDDIQFWIDKDDTRRFASQGQQRSITLALKMGEIEILKRVSGKEPLLLLDDVMSELDPTRRSFFTELIKEAGQTVITTTNLGYFEEDFLKDATIVRLKEKNSIER